MLRKKPWRYVKQELGSVNTSHSTLNFAGPAVI